MPNITTAKVIDDIQNFHLFHRCISEPNIKSKHCTCSKLRFHLFSNIRQNEFFVYFKIKSASG